MRVMLGLLATLAVAAVLAPAAHAVPLVLTNGPTLVRTDTNSLNTTSSPVTITGMQPGEVLRGIDQRPDTGQIYGIGSLNRVYVLNPTTGAATQVGSAAFPSLNGTFFGTDFDPTADQIRLVSNFAENMRINPNDGAGTTDDDLSPPGNVVASAYTNNTSSAATTTLYGIDSAAGTLVQQGGVNGSPSPNDGAITTIGAGLGLGTNLSETIGMDVGADTATFATITSGMVSRLYGINLSTGQATSLGTIGNGTTAFLGLAVTPARMRLTTGALAASEGATAQFQVVRNAPAAGPVSVDYATSAGTATSGADFTPASGTLTWAAGESGPKTIAVPVTVDTGAEGAETFTVTISNVTGADAVFGRPTAATATIAANPAGPALGFAAPASTATEGSNATLSVRRVGSAAHPVSIRYATFPGTAGATDFTAGSGTVSWRAGDGAAKTISIPVADDPGAEGPETCGVRLSSPGGGATLGNPAAATVTIASSDQPPAARAPTLRLRGATRQKLRTVRRRGVAITATIDSPCRLTATVRRGSKRIGRRIQSLSARRVSMRVRIKRSQRRRLRARQRLRVTATCANAAGPSAPARRTVRLRR